MGVSLGAYPVRRIPKVASLKSRLTLYGEIDESAPAKQSWKQWPKDMFPMQSSKQCICKFGRWLALSLVVTAEGGSAVTTSVCDLLAVAGCGACLAMEFIPWVCVQAAVSPRVRAQRESARG